MKKYRLPRKPKKAERTNLIYLINKDMSENNGGGLPKRKAKSLRCHRWIMLGVVYHKWEYTK